MLALLLLPLVFGYQLSDYTGGDVYLQPGRETVLSLPFPEGNACLPVAVLFVRGGEDYPVIRVNGKPLEGGGVHRIVLEGNVVEVNASTSLPAVIEGNSLIYCTTDPFITVEYVPPSPIVVGNYNFLHIAIKNEGFSPGEVNLLLAFHPNLAPYHPPYTRLRIPAKSSVTYNMFLLASPFEMRLSSHPRVCVAYVDSIMRVRECDGPVPTRSEVRPVVRCVNGVCINSSNVVLELNGASVYPGDVLPEGVLEQISGLNVEIVKKTLTSGNDVFRAQTGNLGWVFILLGLVVVAVRYAGFL